MDLDLEIRRAKIGVSVTALLLALMLTNPSPEDYRLWNRAPAANRTNLTICTLYDGHVVGIFNFFLSM